MPVKRKLPPRRVKGKPKAPSSGGSRVRLARTKDQKPETSKGAIPPTNGNAAQAWYDGLSENERFRHDAVVALSQFLNKAADAARECVLRFTGPDRGRYRSVQTLLLACKKALRERNTAPIGLQDLEAAGQGGVAVSATHFTASVFAHALKRARGELGPDPLARIATEIAVYVLPAHGESPKTEDELLAWMANTWPDERVAEFSKLQKQRSEREGIAPPAETGPQERIPRSRVEWAQRVRGRLKTVLRCGGDERLLAKVCVETVENELHAAPEISDLRVLNILDETPEVREKLRKEAEKKVTRYFLDTRDAERDPEAILRRLLVLFGDQPRKARGLFEAESKRIKR